MLIDTHCHVHFRSYDADQEQVIKRSLENGVSMITVGTQKETSQQAVDCAMSHEGVWAAIGMHPSHASEDAHFDEDELSEGTHPHEVFDPMLYRQLAQNKKVVAIGECGLDYYRLSESTKNQDIKNQKQVFRAHLDLADELHLPVIIHCRDAYQDVLMMVKEYVDQHRLVRRGVVHCFAGTIEEAKAFVDLGFLIGITGIVTFPPRKTDVTFDGYSLLQQIVRELPLSSLLVETDAPYLTPSPHRGERNEPGYVTFVAEKIAELKEVSKNEIEAQTTENAEKLFGIK